MTKTSRARYTLEFKQEAVRLAENGQSIAAMARTLAALVQQGPAAFNAGLRQSGAFRANLACGSAQASQFMISAVRYAIQGQGQFFNRINLKDLPFPIMNDNVLYHS